MRITIQRLFRVNHFSNNKNDGIFYISDQIKVSRVPLSLLPGEPLEITLTVPLNEGTVSVILSDLPFINLDLYPLDIWFSKKEISRQLRFRGGAL